MEISSHSLCQRSRITVFLTGWCGSRSSWVCLGSPEDLTPLSQVRPTPSCLTTPFHDLFSLEVSICRGLRTSTQKRPGTDVTLDTHVLSFEIVGLSFCDIPSSFLFRDSASRFLPSTRVVGSVSNTSQDVSHNRVRGISFGSTLCTSQTK